MTQRIVNIYPIGVDIKPSVYTLDEFRINDFNFVVYQFNQELRIYFTRRDAQRLLEKLQKLLNETRREGIKPG